MVEMTKEERNRVEDILSDIISERISQNKKWGRSWGTWDRSLDRKLAVLMEEVGEVAEAILDDDPVEHLREEIIQVAAVCVQWLEHLDANNMYPS